MVTVSSASDTQDERKIVNVGLIQTALSADITDNIRRTVDKVEEASRMGAQIICLPELYRTWYFPQEEKIDVGNLAETVPGETTKTFSNLAKKNGTVIIAPIFEKAPNGKYYNSALVIDADGKIVLETIVSTAAGPIRRLLESINGPVHVTLEETTQSERLHDLLQG